MNKNLAVSLILVLATVFTFTACGDDDPTIIIPQCRMSGTVTFPDANATGVVLDGEPYRIVIDTDSTVDNGNEVATYNLTWSGTDTSDYSINIKDITPGAYYIYVEATDGSTYFMYGWTGADVASDYHTPRATVDIDCKTTLDLWMEIT